MDYIQPIWWVQTLSRVPSLGNTRWTLWKGAHLEYILNFLSTTGCKKWSQWTTTGVTTNDIAATKKRVKSFPDHLASQMDHTVSQQCQIYQLEDVWIKPAETPDELVDHLRALTNRCYFPTDEAKEWNVQFCPVHALTDSELVKKLLTLDLKATTAKILKTCRGHIAIADNPSAMHLRSKTVNAVSKLSQWPQSCPQQQQQKHWTPWTNMHVGIALSPIHLAQPPALPWTPHANHVAE